MVRNTFVPTWAYPGSIGRLPRRVRAPQPTAAGYLLANAMTSLPEQKVSQVLTSGWGTWLNWHTTDAQLAAALGIRCPVSLPPGSHRTDDRAAATGHAAEPGVHGVTRRRHRAAAREPGRPPAAPSGARAGPAPSWLRALPLLARPVTRTMPWVTLITGCLAGTAFLAVMAHVADASHSPLGQGTVRLAFLPAIAALAFVLRAPFRPLTQATPVPAWVTPASHLLLAAPVLAATCWAQLRIMAHTIPPASSATRPPSTR